MPKRNLVSPSRDGDQFHYVWAARRCLLLLSAVSNLKAITIEGASPSENGTTVADVPGDELIDVAEYYGSENINEASLVRYIQVKHSTVRTDQAWPPSGLAKTLKGFAARYKALQQSFSVDTLNAKLEFQFVSNRPINSDFLEAVHDAAENLTPRHPKDLKKLERFTGLCGAPLAAFCKLLRLEGNQEGLWDQRNLLAQDTSGYLADADVDAPGQLKELVTGKALSERRGHPEITRMDVLRALKTTEFHLFPAPCFITVDENVIPREQERALIDSIVQAERVPGIVHAAGGVGKSVFATRIGLGLPAGSLSILYDCFGNGLYRNARKYRHRHEDALVQIANELAMKGLCHPLIPTSRAKPSDYARAFLHRLRQSITSLRSAKPQALLCIVIDAADNAQMAAEEIGESRSFIRDLIREELPEGVRLVALCRTHRQELLDPPPNALKLPLDPFSRAETATHLRRTFSDATEPDIDEFHRLSSQNPRVQALALARQAPLHEILRALGPNPTTVDDAIEGLLNAAVAKLRDDAGAAEKDQIDRICAGLAALRPLIPLSVLAAISGVDEAAIRSFAFDLGRPLLIAGDTIQFFDEPAETWFRDKFKPASGELMGFVATLKPLAAQSAYVASALPQLMLEAGHLSELVALALSSEALPTDSPIEKRDVELQRLQFALKASLRRKRYADAAKLALKAGGEAAGDERQRGLLQTNTDLAAVFLESDGIQELVSRRTFGAGWVGSHHAYEAGLLSGHTELRGDARSRLRMAHEWLRNWIRLPKEERQREGVKDEDILEMASAAFNIHGANGCAYELRRWHPREVSFRVGRMLAARFVDHGRYQELDELALAAGNDLWLVLAITLELAEVHRTPPEPVVVRALRLTLDRRIDLEANGVWRHNESVELAVTSLVSAAHKLSVSTTDKLVELLTRYLPSSPPHGLSSHYSGQRLPLLRAYALRAALSDKLLTLTDLAPEGLRKELENPKNHSESREIREFKESIGALLPWHRLWAATFINRVTADGLGAAIADATAESKKAQGHYFYRDEAHTTDEIARVWYDVLLNTQGGDNALFEQFEQWVMGLKRSLFTPTLTRLARLAARFPAQDARALTFADKAYGPIRDEREDASAKTESYVSLARAVLAVSPSDARIYFDHAVEVAGKIGDENLSRWTALLDLADRAAERNNPRPETAYRLARCAELTHQYDGDHFLWEPTVKTISGLCGKSSLAILSRWRDRDFGWMEETLPVAVNFLVERGDLDPKLALALTAIRAQWDKPLLLKHVLSACGDKAEKVAAANFVYRYMTLEPQSAESWRSLKSILLAHDLAFPELDERIDFGEREKRSQEAQQENSEPTHRSRLERGNTRDWDGVFAGINLADANGIAQAHRRFKDTEPPYYHETFLAEAFRRVRVGKEAEFIAAFADVAEFDLYNLRQLLEQIPENWKVRPSVKPALGRAIKSFCRRFCMGIQRSRFHEWFPFKTACELSGISESELSEVVLTGIGETNESFGANRLFSLVGLLAEKLTKEEAVEALSFGLDLFDAIIEDKDGDGPWSPGLAPPADFDATVAGYIWACLAAPEAALRWEAAHVVRALFTLGLTNPLGHIVALARGGTPRAFVDAHLHFYALHARLWLLIGLARAAKERPELIVPHIEFLKDIVFAGEPHVLMREFAKRTLIALLNAGVWVPEEDMRECLSRVNMSPFPPAESRYYRRAERSLGPDGVVDGFTFGIDIGPYWFAPLGLCFATAQTDIERMALQVIKRDWRFSGGARWDDDERHRRKIFRDSNTRHSHGSYPRVDELRFYFSYHAMMVVAGKLLASIPVHHDPDYSEDDFHGWLRRHDLTRQNGGWLADRRDPFPLEKLLWKEEKENNEWRWGIVRNDFDQVLLPAEGRMNLWGHWKWVAGRRQESVSVNSALVSSGRSAALLSALHSVTNSHDYRIPDANDDLQIDFDGFQLKGWIIDQSSDGRLDEKDPWAGEIHYPAPRPAPYVIELMNLESDEEQRCWFVNGEQSAVAWSQVWGHYYEKDHDEANQGAGERFQASLGFVVSLLHKLGMDLIVEVEIDRNLQRFNWEGSNNDDFGYILPSTRLFLIKSDGSICTL